MNILAISSSTQKVYVVLRYNGVIDFSEFEGKSSGSKIISMIKNLFDKNNVNINKIENFSIDLGPGSFTGIRVGIATLQGLLLPTKVNEVRAIYSMDLINESVNLKKEKSIIVKKARQGAYYVGLFNNGVLENNYEMISFELLKKLLKGRIVIADKRSKNDILDNDFSQNVLDAKIDFNSIIKVAERSEKIPIENVNPLYLQKPVAVDTWEKNNSKKLDKNIYN